MLREGVRDWAAQRRMVLLVGTVSAVLVALLLALQGSLMRQRQDQVDVLQSPAVRTLMVTYRGGGFAPFFVRVLGELDGVEYVVGLGAGEDVRSAVLDGRDPVVLRHAVTVGWADDVLAPADDARPADAAISIGGAVDRLGFRQGVGAVELANGLQRNVTGNVPAPRGFPVGGPALLVPASAGDRLDTVVVRVTSTTYLPIVRSVVLGAATGRVGDEIQVSESESLAAATDRLTSLGAAQDRSLKLGAIAIAVATNGAIGVYVVTTRRRDLGRKRALGASSTQLLAMTVAGHATVTLLGSLVGLVAAVVIGSRAGSAPPSLSLVTAATAASTGAGLLGILPPALVAASRSPLSELRRP
ncbi:MAG: FtsX-like permease family protein [Desertimonas sp.]